MAKLCESCINFPLCDWLIGLVCASQLCLYVNHGFGCAQQEWTCYNILKQVVAKSECRLNSCIHTVLGMLLGVSWPRPGQGQLRSQTFWTVLGPWYLILGSGLDLKFRHIILSTAWAECFKAQTSTFHRVAKGGLSWGHGGWMVGKSMNQDRAEDLRMRNIGEYYLHNLPLVQIRPPTTTL